jgi:hypothetical protein
MARARHALTRLEDMRKTLWHEEPDRVPGSDFCWSRRPGMGLASAIVMGPGAQPGALTRLFTK